jgi:hypothetical protein
MRKILIPALAATLLAGCAATTATSTTRYASEEAKLAERLKGRVAGEPVDCIPLNQIRSTRIYGGTAIVYEGGNGTLYVNRPHDASSALRFDPILVTNTHSSELCSIDIVRLLDRSGRFQVGTVFLDKFLPYRKARS